MKVTHFGTDGFPWAHVSNFGGTTISIGSNSDTNPPLSSLNFVQRITANSSNVMLNPIVNFAAGSNILLTLDQGPLPAQAMPSNTIRIHSTGGSGGNIITANGSNSLAAVVNLVAGTNIALGVSGQNITITNTQAAGGSGGSTGSSGALVLLEQHTASSSSSLDFTTGITSTYDDYMLDIIGLIPATNGAVLYLRFSTDGGSTYDTSSIYYWEMGYWHFQGAGDTGQHGSGGGGASRIEFFEDGAGAAISTTNGISVQVHMPDPGSSARHKLVTFHGDVYYSGNSNWYYFTGGGAYATNTAANAFRLIMSSGNISSGVARLYGIAKS